MAILHSTALMKVIGQQPGEPGRARKYEDRFCDDVREMAQRGLFPEEWAAFFGVHFATMRLWVQDNPEFREAVMVGRVLLAAYWTGQARKKAEGGIPSPILGEVLRKRFPELYGKKAQNIWAAVLDEPATEAIEGEKPMTQPMTLAEMEARLKVLAERRKGDSEK